LKSRMRRGWQVLVVALFLCCLFRIVSCNDYEEEEEAHVKHDNSAPGRVDAVLQHFFENDAKEKGRHDNNWAVLVCTSKFWYNYRHTTNTMVFYHLVKKLGISDSNILLFLAEDTACNPRNPVPATVFAAYEDQEELHDFYQGDIEVDYRGPEVSVENLIRVLTAKHDDFTPKSKRLLSNERSNVLVYLTGHGGDGFIKFQNTETITSEDIANTFQQMDLQNRYKSLMFISDTCQASSLYSTLNSSNTISISSSRVGENSYSYRDDYTIGISLIDRFAYFTWRFFTRSALSKSSAIAARNHARTEKLHQLFYHYQHEKMLSNVTWDLNLHDLQFNNIKLMDFFGSNSDVIVF